MADFENPYYIPMDRAYEMNLPENNQRTDSIEEPLFPVSKVGKTIAWESKRGSIMGEVEAAFRGGAGNVQLVMESPGQMSPIGGGPKAYGREIREAIREVQLASGAKVTGVELPTSINNLSGYSQQGFSEQQRQMNLAEVRDTINFVGDISGGGSVDIVSFEFDRNFSDAKWAEKEGGKFRQMGEEIPSFVDQETGKIQQIHPSQKLLLHRNPETNEVDNDDVHEWTWDTFKKWAPSEKKKPVELLIQYQLKDEQERQLKMKKLNWEIQIQDAEERATSYSYHAKQQGLPEEERKRYEQFSEDYKRLMKELKKNESEFKREEDELNRVTKRFVPVDELGVKRSVDSYATAGIWAMQESQKNQFVKKAKSAVTVGPEIGWPQYYGSHPEEWVGLIKEARKKMVEKLTSDKIKNPITGREEANPYFDSSISEKDAYELAKTHIKGELDTGHMGMWYNNFRPELPNDERLKQFKKWYKEQIEFIAKENKKEDLIGGIQIVDSASGAHGHLPPGEGILGNDLFEYMKILKEKGGYNGELTSEGHEDMAVGPERILTKAWETMGSHVMLPYSTGSSQTISDIRHAQARTPYGTNQIYQSYVPSNDFTLWSQVPLE